MDRAHPSAGQRRLGPLADVIEILLTQERDGAVRVRRPDKAGNRIDDVLKPALVAPKRGLAGAQSLLCSLSVLNIDNDPVPFENVSIVVQQRALAKCEPPVFTITAPHAAFRLPRPL